MIRICIVRFSSIGDILHSSSILSYLTHPELKYKTNITWLTDKQFIPLLSQYRAINQVIGLPLSAIRKKPFYLKFYLDLICEIIKIRKEQFDYVIDVQGLLKSGLATFFLKSKTKLGYSKPEAREGSHWFYHQKINVSHIVNIIEKQLFLISAIKELGQLQKTINQKNINLLHPKIISLPNYEMASINNFFQKNKCNFPILINPWSSVKIKELPIELLIKLCDYIKKVWNVKPFILSGPENYQIITNFIEQGKFNAIRSPLFSIHQLFNFISRFSLYIGTDSGPSYISILSKIPTLLIFGPTNASRQVPSYQNVKILYSNYHCNTRKDIQTSITPYLCLNKNCQNNQCISAFNVKEIIQEAKKILDINN